MPSHLRLQSSFEPIPAKASYQQTSPSSPPSKKQKMSLTQTYYVASAARSKLGHEANRADHNLRLLVGHANLLDSLMVELADAEREQEAWFNQSVTKASRPEEPRHIQWVDTIAEAEEEEEDDSDLDSDADSDVYDEDIEMLELPVHHKIRTTPVQIDSTTPYPNDDDEDDEESDEESDNDDLALTRVASRHSPPELTLDSDSESEDDFSPASPEQPAFAPLSEKQRAEITSTTTANNFYDIKDVIMQQQQQSMPQQQPLIAAC